MSVFVDDLLCLVTLPNMLKENPFRLGMQWGTAWAAHLDVDPQFPNDTQRAAFPVALSNFAGTFDRIFGPAPELEAHRQGLCREAQEAWHRAYNTAFYDEFDQHPDYRLPPFSGNAAAIYRELTGLGWNPEWGVPRGMPATPQLDALRILTSVPLEAIDSSHIHYRDLGTMAVFCWMALYLDAGTAHGVFKVFLERAATAGFLESPLIKEGIPVTYGALQAAFDEILKRAAELPEFAHKQAEGDDDAPLGFVSAARLSEIFKVPSESLRKWLERFRRNNDMGWKEVEKESPHDPKYLYDPQILGPEIRRTYPSVQGPARRNRRR